MFQSELLEDTRSLFLHLTLIILNSGHTSIDEFWNFKEKVDSDAFVVPSICQQLEISGEIESREVAYELNGLPQLY